MNFPALFLYLIMLVIGLCFGSFLNVIVYRLPNNISVTTPPSRCPSCDRRLGFVDLIPLIGYLILRGRCRSCGVRISLRYPLVELATGLLTLALFIKFGLTMEFFLYFILLFLLFAIAQIDLEKRIVPNKLVLIGLIFGLLLYLPQIISIVTYIPPVFTAARPVTDGLIGLLLGGGIMLIIFLVSRGGMGAGDIKLMALIGFYVGVRGTALVMLFGFFFGALVGVTYMILGKLTRKDALPFAPYLSLATLVEVFWGEQLWNIYINLF